MILKRLLLSLAVVAYGVNSTVAQEAESTLTSNTSQDIVPGSIACSDSSTGVVSENHYFKKFDLTDLRVADEFDIHSFQFGVQSVHSARGFSSNIDLHIKLWQTKTTDFPANWESGDYNELISKSVTVTNADDGAIITIDFDYPITVERDDIIIAQVSNNDLEGQTFYIGSNNASDHEPSYIMAEDCNLLTPTPVAEIGFPDMHIVMNLKGNGSILGIQDEVAETDLILYPNPTSDQFSITSGNESIKSVVIRNMLGRTIQSIKVNSLNHNMNVSNLPRGVYLIEVELETGKAVKKLIKK